MNIVKASEEFKFQFSPESFVSPTFYCFNYKNKEDFINYVKNKINKFPYLLYFDGGNNLLYLDNEQSKQLFINCLGTYYDNFNKSEYEKTFNGIVELLDIFNPELRKSVLKELSNYNYVSDRKIDENDILDDILDIEL